MQRYATVYLLSSSMFSDITLAMVGIFTPRKLANTVNLYLFLTHSLLLNIYQYTTGLGRHLGYT